MMAGRMVRDGVRWRMNVTRTVAWFLEGQHRIEGMRSCSRLCFFDHLSIHHVCVQLQKQLTLQTSTTSWAMRSRSLSTHF